MMNLVIFMWSYAYDLTPECDNALTEVTEPQ